MTIRKTFVTKRVKFLEFKRTSAYCWLETLDYSEECNRVISKSIPLFIEPNPKVLKMELKRIVDRGLQKRYIKIVKKIIELYLSTRDC